MKCDISHIQKYYDDQIYIAEKLKDVGEISASISIRDILTRFLVIASASYFEDTLRTAVTKFAETNSKNSMLWDFCRNTGIDRQYHTWFDWKSSNASKFFSIFGDNNKTKMNSLIKERELDDAVKQFILLGAVRNHIAHNNILNVNIQSTPEETFVNVKLAAKFVELVINEMLCLREGPPLDNADDA